MSSTAPEDAVKVECRNACLSFGVETAAISMETQRIFEGEVVLGDEEGKCAE